MPYIVLIHLRKFPVSSDTWMRQPPAQPLEPTATLRLKPHNMTWEVRTNKQGFLGTFGASQGRIQADTDYTLLYPSGNPLLQLQYFSMDMQARKHGFAFCDSNPNAVRTMMGGVANPFLNCTYYWRKLDPKEMTAAERVEEMYYICCEKYLEPSLKAQLAGLATAENLRNTAGIFLVFLLAGAMGWELFIGALRVLLGAFDVTVNYSLYKPSWDMFVRAATQPTTEQGLEHGAHALAEILGAIIGAKVGGMITSAATKPIAARFPADRFRQAVTGKSPAEWKLAGERGRQQAQKEGLEEYRDPKMTPEQYRQRLKGAPGKKPDLSDPVMAQRFKKQWEIVKQIAPKFGISPAHAERLAQLCAHNGWTIIVRASKVASLKWHQMEAVGKSLFVSWKIDPQHGVIIRKPGMSIEQEIYNGYMVKQLKTTKQSNNPHGNPKDWEPTPAEIARAKAENVFEWKPGLVPGKEVLTHNGKIVIGDYDLMGVYVRAGDALVPLPQWAVHNDASHLQAFINSTLGGPRMSHHGGQDTSGGPGGRPVRTPDPGERYIVFKPNGEVQGVENTKSLQTYYERARIVWPYKTFFDLTQINFAKYCMQARERKPTPEKRR